MQKLFYLLSGDKEYNITVSVGIVAVKATQGMTLEETLVKADEQLYEAKNLKSSVAVTADRKKDG